MLRARLGVAGFVLALSLVIAMVAQGAVHDTLLVSRTTDGVAANGDSGPGLATSGSGRYVAFESSADNLSSEDEDAVTSVFVRDTQTGTTELVSRATGPDGAVGNGDSRNPAISPGGRLVAFESDADNLSTEDDDGVTNIYVRNVVADTTTLVSLASDGTAADGDSRRPSVSAYMKTVAFESDAANLSAEDDDAVTDVFARDVQAGTTTLVSRATGTLPGGDDDSFDPSVSSNGQKIAFVSNADNLNYDPARISINNDVTNLYVYDLRFKYATHESRTTRSGIVSQPADGDSYDPSISSNGRYVAFVSDADNLDDAPTPGIPDVYVRDTNAGQTTLTSRATGAAGVPADGPSFSPSVSHDGRVVAFVSAAENLTTEDVATYDVFVRRGELTSGTGVAYSWTELASRSSGPTGPAATGSSLAASISEDARVLSFVSEGDNLSADDDDTVLNVFTRGLPASFAPPPPPDLGDNDHGEHGGGHSGTAGGGHTGHTAGGGATHAGHDEDAPSQTLIGPPVQRVDRLFVLAQVHEAGLLLVNASVNVRARGKASRVLRFKRFSRKVPAHKVNRVRLRLTPRSLRSVKGALRRGARLTVRVVARAQDSAGNWGTARMKIRLRP